MPKRKPDTTNEPAQAAIERFIAANPGLASVDLLISDINGIMRGKNAPASALSKLASPGMNLPLSVFGLDVWGREVAATNLHIESGDLDGYCRLVPDRLTMMPWTGAQGGSGAPAAQALLTMHDAQGQPFAGDPRHALAGVVARLAARGLKAVTAVELEFYLVEEEAFLRDGRLSGEPAAGPTAQDMYALSAIDSHERFFSDIRAGATVQGLPVDTIIKEAAAGQYEINLVHRDDALGAADDAVLLKRLICETARRHGLRATFMAKPFAGWPGNGLHVHASLLDGDGANVFSADGGEQRLGHAAAGLLTHMQECLLAFVPTVNGFRRLQPGSYAPTRLAWGDNNRSVAVRVPASEAKSRRLEHRLASADANPHLVMALVLGAMLAGLDAAVPPPPKAEGNVYESDQPELSARMDLAIAAFEHSPFVADMLGEELRRIFVAVKRAELEAFDNEVTPLERVTYL